MINNRTTYAIRALWQLAQSDEYFSTSEAIAEAQDIPKKFLPQILGDLSRAGLVRSIRGFGGGARLSRPPQKINLLEILEVVQGNMFMYDYIDGGAGNPALPDAKLTKIYKKAQDAMKAEFAKIVLSDLKVKGAKKKAKRIKR